MNKKNIRHYPSTPKKKFSSWKDVTWKDVTTGIMITAGVLATNLSEAKTNVSTNTQSSHTKTHVEKNKNTGQKETTIIPNDIFNISKFSDNQNIIQQISTTHFDDILKTHGIKKGIEIIRQGFLEEINTYRKILGYKPLQLCTQLNKISQEHAEEMAKHFYISHTNQNGDGPGERAKKANISYKGISENISQNSETITSVIDSYKRSKNESGHYKIFEPQYTKLGFGITKDPIHGTYFLVFVYTY